MEGGRTYINEQARLQRIERVHRRTLIHSLARTNARGRARAHTQIKYSIFLTERVLDSLQLFFFIDIFI